MRISIFLFICSLISSNLIAQSLEDDPSVMYMKANVLYDSGRYDEAIRMYNGIISDNDEYYQAYIMRAKAKYALGAYRGTKKDILKFIEKQGVTKEVVKIMAKAELELENYEAAQNYVNTSLQLDPYDGEQYRIAGLIMLQLKNKNDACELFSRASKLRDNKSADLLEKHCGVIIQIKKEMERKKKRDHQKEHEDAETEIQTEEKPQSREKIDIDILNGKLPKRNKDREIPIEIESGVEEADRDAIQEIEIDEELSLVIGNGLGKRKVDQSPMIFMGSSDKGKVVVDICVDGTGQVISAEFAKNMSDLKKGGVVSLALRKAKEFVFYPSFRDEQCGYIIFVIK